MELLAPLTLLSNVCIYQESPLVKSLKPSDIYNLSRDKNDDLHLIQYYSEITENMANISKNLESSAQAMTGYLKVGAINLYNYPLASYVNDFPSLPIYGFYGYYKSYPDFFNRISSLNDIHEEASKQLSYIFDERAITRYVPSRDNYEMGYMDVEMRLNASLEAWGVVYYNQECQKSSDFSKIWNELVESLHQIFRFASINNRAYDITKTSDYPVIKFFPEGSKYVQEPITYDGTALDFESIYTFFHDKIGAAEIWQILNVNNVTPCFKRKFCVGIFMPKIMDCDGKCRYNSLQIFQQACEKFKQYSLHCVWSQFDEQPELQSLFAVKSSTKPVVVILNVPSESYKKTLLQNDFTLNDLEEIFDSIRNLDGFSEELIIQNIPGVMNIEELHLRDEL